MSRERVRRERAVGVRPDRTARGILSDAAPVNDLLALLRQTDDDLRDGAMVRTIVRREVAVSRAMPRSARGLAEAS